MLVRETLRCSFAWPIAIRNAAASPKDKLKLHKKNKSKQKYNNKSNFKAFATSVRVSVSISTHYAAPPPPPPLRFASLRFAAPDCYQCTRYVLLVVVVVVVVFVVLVFAPRLLCSCRVALLCNVSLAGYVCMCVCLCWPSLTSQLAKLVIRASWTCHRPQYGYNMSAFTFMSTSLWPLPMANAISLRFISPKGLFTWRIVLIMANVCVCVCTTKGQWVKACLYTPRKTS